MRFAPLAVVLLLFAAHALLTGAWARETFDYVNDLAIWRAILFVEMALPMFVLWPATGGRREVGGLLAVAAACFAVSTATMALFAYLSTPGPLWQSRPLLLAIWGLCAGFMALGTRAGGAWLARTRIALVCVLGLPLLWQYFSLEYALKSQLWTQALSPHWWLGANPAEFGGGPVVLPLGIAGAAALAAALAWPSRKEAA